MFRGALKALTLLPVRGGLPRGGWAARACQLPAILLWMHNGLGYIYGDHGQTGWWPEGVEGAMRARPKRNRI